MNQITRFSVEQISYLLDIMKTGRTNGEYADCEVDWVNRTIRVLSETKINPKLILSSGPAQYKDILFQLDSK